MDTGNDSLIAQYRDLDLKLAFAREVYKSRMFSRLYNLFVESSSNDEPEEVLVITLDSQLSNSDLLRKIHYLEKQLQELSQKL